MKNQQQAMEVGTILVSQWGYDQTNVDFYEVVKATKTMVYVQRIEKKCEPVAWLQTDCTPIPGEYIGDAIRRKVKNFRADGDPRYSFIEIESYEHAYVHDGRKVRETSWA